MTCKYYIYGRDRHGTSINAFVTESEKDLDTNVEEVIMELIKKHPCLEGAESFHIQSPLSDIIVEYCGCGYDYYVNSGYVDEEYFQKEEVEKDE